MNFRYYNSLAENNKDYVLFLSKHIEPKLNSKEYSTFFDDIRRLELNSKDKDSIEGFIGLDFDNNSTLDLMKLSDDQLKHLYQVFISQEVNDRLAIKWRLYSYLKYAREINVKKIQIDRSGNPDQLLDIIIENDKGETLFILCFDKLELTIFYSAIDYIKDFVKKHKIIPDKIIFAADKTYRNIPIEEIIKIDSTEIIPELWLEWKEINLPFKGEDLLIVNDSELKVAGFNFSSLHALLGFIFKNSKGGEIKIFKEIDYFEEEGDDSDDSEPEIELIWKGIMIKE